MKALGEDETIPMYDEETVNISMEGRDEDLHIFVFRGKKELFKLEIPIKYVVKAIK